MVPCIVPVEGKSAAVDPEEGHTRGGSVEVLPKGEIGTVVRLTDRTGNVLVRVERKRHLANQERLRLKVRTSELYPEDYDLSIMFDNAENRKARHQMERKYTGDTEVWVEE